MGRLAVGLAALAAVVLGLTGAAQAAKYQWKLATLAPKGVGWAIQVENIFFPYIEQATKGDLEFKIYWGGVMGDDNDCLKKMRIGQLHGAGLSAQGAVLAVPEFSVTELPFLFNDFDELDYVREKMAAAFDAVTEKHGFKLITWIDQDFDQIYSVKYPMNKLEDFSKARVVTWSGLLEQNLLTTLGACPIPIQVPEIPASTRAGIVDTLISPSIWMVGTQVYTVAKYVNPIKIRYSPALIIVAMDVWNNLPPEYQKNILDRRPEIQSRLYKGVREDNARLYKAMVQYGVQEVKVKPEDFEKIKERSMAVYKAMAGKLYDAAPLEELQGHLAEYRKGGKPAAAAAAQPVAAR
jgi:TRAP-type C4-dicarboxylate transport system substrate-binding protein